MEEPKVVQADAQDYPHVSLGGKDYEVRFSVGAVLRLKRLYDIDMEQLSNKCPVCEGDKAIENCPTCGGTGTILLKGAEAIDRVCKLLAAAIGNQTKLTSMEIADMIDIPRLQYYADAVNEAIKKAGESKSPKKEPAATPTVN